MSHVYLRNANVPCRYFGNFHVNFKMVPCSTMGGLGRVMVPIENALGDSAPPQGRV